MRICIFYSGNFGKRVIGNLVNPSTFCKSCGDLCDHCRESRGSHAAQISEIHELPTELPDFIEEPMEYLPDNLGSCDLILAMDLHPDLLTTLPYVAEKTGAKAVIVPIENHRLAPAGAVEKVKKELEAAGVDCEFPKPFCSLGKTGKPLIDEFVDMGFGKPVLEVDLSPEKDMFAHVRVLRDAPCGSTCFVAKKLNWSDVKDYKETVSGAHHAYPCTGSMERDPQIGDTILHEAGYIIRKSVEEGMEKASKEKSE